MNLKDCLNQDLTRYESIPFWSWNDELEPDELRQQIRAMKKAGIGGFFMHARGGLTTEYLGEKWFEATDACIDEAKKLGMDAWCYDENGWPSGFAGMKLLEDEANWVHYVVCEKKNAFDKSAMAVYVLEGEKLVRVHGDAGEKEYITLYDRTNSSVVDILNPKIVKKFLNETHEKYFARFGAEFGKAMKGFFTDEPQYFRWDTAYTPVILKAYSEKYGRDLLDEMGALFVDCAEAKPVRYRYWKLMNELYTLNFAKQIYDWCDAHNCQLTGHTIQENDLFGQMICSAGVMPFYKYEHKPGVDWLGREISAELCPRQCSSVAQQYGKKHVLTETFACAGWDVSPRELKRIAEWQYVNGINQMCQHLYPYSIRGQRKRDYPAFYSEHNTWTKAEDFKHFNDYFTALGYMLAESEEIASVAVIHPMHSAYLTFNRNDPKSVSTLNDKFFELIELLGRANIGHHYIDETLLSEDGRVDGAKLIMGKCAYTAVVVPEMENLDASTAKMLEQYVQNGGKLYLQGKTPCLIDGSPAEMPFLKSNVTLEELVPDAYSIDAPGTDVHSTMRASAFGKFLFAVNLSEEATYRVRYRFHARGAKRFNLETRECEPIHFMAEGEYITVPLTFAPGESTVILLDDAAKSAEEAPGKANWTELDLNAEIVSADENTLTLDNVALSYDGTAFGEPLPVMAASDRLLRGRTNRKVWLKYAFDVREIPQSLRVECEDMGLVSAELNGEKLELGKGNTFDPSFLMADALNKLKIGRNELVFEIYYYQPQLVYDVFNGVYYEHSDGTESLINCLSYRTDIEAVYLRGDFGVHTTGFTPGKRNTLIAKDEFAIERAQKRVRANALAECGYPFFGGSVTLKLNAQARGDETALKLTGRYMLAKVRVNGGEAQTLMFGDTADVAGKLHAGENEIEITLVSSYRNVFGPFHFAPDPEPLGVSPDLFAGYGHWSEEGKSELYTGDYAFVRFGLTGAELA